jgi:16S rRNA (cytosine967-C5)-methyltransferase
MTEGRAAPSVGHGLPVRLLAVEVLRRVEQARAYADVALDGALRETELDARDRALATRLVYGTLAWQKLLDWHLAALAGRDPSQLDPAVRIVLRLGLYQVLLLERIPVHAAVATSVDLAKRLAPAAAGLVNAVLRRGARERGTLALPDPSDSTRHLAVALSHPEWLVTRWQARFPHAELRALLAADNEAAPTVLRARVGTRDALIARLAADGVGAEACRFAPDGVHVNAVAPHRLAGFARGAFSVQSEASQLVARLVAPRPGMRVLDACAAPGGKAAYLAEMMGDRGTVVALDGRPRRAAAVAAEARRLGLRAVAAVAADARTAAALLAGSVFDRILVDAPCSGLGTLRAHPELRWTREPADLERLAALQREILEGVTPLLAAGGVAVYATCTISEPENEEVVRAWLADHRGLEIEPAASFLPVQAADLVDAHGAMRTFPHRHDLDGFYAVRVRRSVA